VETAKLVAGSRTVQDDLGVDDLRAGVLRNLAVCVMASGLLALIVLYDSNRVLTWLPAISLSIVGYLALRFARMNSVVTSVALLASLWLILTGSTLLYPGRPLAPIYCLVVLPAAFLLSPMAATVVALAAGGAIAYFAGHNPSLETGDTYALALFLVGFVVIQAWLLASPLTTALGWAWTAYEQAEQKMNEARSRQVELGRVTKSLNETLTSLQDLNRQLAEARAVAERARRLKAEFAAAVSHELRTPLNLIIGFAEILVQPNRGRSAPALPEAARKQLQTVYRNACHLSNLVDDILDLSQIDAHRLALHKEMIEMADVVAEATAVVRDLIEDGNLALIVDVPSGLTPIHADRTRLRQILINLLGNANRFTDAGAVTVRARGVERSIVVTVSDTGMGIPPDDLPYVFEEFRQFGERRGGSGLGLSICKRLIELHGGNMWVESTLGEGSVFSFSVPSLDAVAGVPSSPSLERRIAAIRRQSGPPTLLVVDPGETSKIFSRYLDTYRIEAVESVEEARKLLATGQASALLFGSSRDASSWQKIQDYKSLPYPIAYCPLRKASHVLPELGVAGFLVKPVTPTQLNAELRRLGTKWTSIGIVEDHPEMADLLIQIARQIRPTCQVWHAANGREAMTLLRRSRPQVLLLDLLMPQLNGYELLLDMRRDERLRDIPVVVISGAEDHDERVVADMVGLTRSGGLTVGEAMACLKRGLDSLLARADSNDPELRAVSGE
jgi:signal transduction histidine kinase/CheY-like chemotaxis protein